MPIKLNKIDSATVAQNLNNNKGRLEGFLTADPASPLRSDPVRYERRCADAALEVGLGSYQQEANVSEITSALAIAGERLTSLARLENSNAALSPMEFEKALALTVCFCPAEVSQQLADTPKERFFADPKALAFYSVLARYLDVIRKFVASGALDQTAWTETQAECERGNASRYDAEVTMAKLNCLRSLIENDASGLNAAITSLIKDHQDEAEHGENQRSTRAFLCLPALMFAKLGATRNLACTVKSPYLPLHLLG